MLCRRYAHQGHVVVVHFFDNQQSCIPVWQLVVSAAQPSDSLSFSQFVAHYYATTLVALWQWWSGVLKPWMFVNHGSASLPCDRGVA